MARTPLRRGVRVAKTSLEDNSVIEGEGYSFVSKFATGTTSVEVITIKNTHATKKMHIDKIIVGASIATIFIAGPVTSGTPAGTPITGFPMNQDQANTAPATAFGNASVTGTVVVADASWLQVPATESMQFDFKGWVFGKDQTFGMRCTSDATVYVTVFAHFENVQ